MWFNFRQNNSGGHFDYDPKRGISVNVCIEADTEAQALNKAEKIGLYFNGCDDGIDCECCGDRWYEGTFKPTEEPSVYEEVVKPGDKYPEQESSLFNKCMKDDEFEGFIHYKSGEFKGFW